MLSKLTHRRCWPLHHPFQNLFSKSIFKIYFQYLFSPHVVCLRCQLGIYASKWPQKGCSPSPPTCASSTPQHRPSMLLRPLTMSFAFLQDCVIRFAPPLVMTDSQMQECELNYSAFPFLFSCLASALLIHRMFVVRHLHHLRCVLGAINSCPQHFFMFSPPKCTMIFPTSFEI
jgi:hypothetical protein